MLKALHFARTLVGQVLQPGAVAVDATAGNGHDTEFLARIVGPSGKVYAFDIQREAVESSTIRLQAAGLQQCATVVHAGHEQMQQYIAPEHVGTIAACMFNLGYLPRGDKSITTRRHTSLLALQTAVEFLAPSGIITVMFYPGHSEGAEEAEHITAWATALPQTHFHVLRYEFVNLRNSPPWLLAIEKNNVLR